MRRAQALLFILAAAPLAADTAIDHQAVACVVAGRFPRLEARFAPDDAVASARVLFQSEAASHWYAVSMKREGTAYVGVLPKPKKELQQFRYYVEVIDRGMATSRTADLTARVVANAPDCQGKLVATGLGTAAVLLQAPAGASLVPAGFASSGVVAAGSGATAAGGAAGAASGGGLSTTAVAVGAGAAAAAAAAAVVVTKESDDDGTNYTGSFTAQRTVQRAYRPLVGAVQICSWTHAISGTVTLELKESGGSVSGEAQFTGNENQVAATCEPMMDRPFTWGGNHELAVSGTTGSFSASVQRPFTNAQGTITNSLSLTGSKSGDTVTLTVTYGQTGELVIAGSGTSTFSGSVTFPVTLR
jgi:hypothetical protein